jgi:multidrug efflux pump subunit AcrA (membrane-fusion protein)
MPENNTNAVINATTGYVNGQNGNVTAFDPNGPHTLDPEIKSFYDTELLENARAELFFAQFAKKQPLPARHGGTVEWREVELGRRMGDRYEVLGGLVSGTQVVVSGQSRLIDGARVEVAK